MARNLTSKGVYHRQHSMLLDNLASEVSRHFYDENLSFNLQLLPPFHERCYSFID